MAKAKVNQTDLLLTHDTTLALLVQAEKYFSAGEAHLAPVPDESVRFAKRTAAEAMDSALGSFDMFGERYRALMSVGKSGRLGPKWAGPSYKDFYKKSRLSVLGTSVALLTMGDYDLVEWVPGTGTGVPGVLELPLAPCYSAAMHAFSACVQYYMIARVKAGGGKII